VSAPIVPANAAPTTELTVGEIIAEQTYAISRDSLVRYAGASGDFNPIHYRDDIARSVGLDGVLAHGMLTMGIAVQPVVEWLGTRGAIVDYQVRFTRPVPVDPSEGAMIKVVAKVGVVDTDGARIDLTVTTGAGMETATTVLGKAQVRVTLASA
jgi:acyl dehydratase